MEWRNREARAWVLIALASVIALAVIFGATKACSVEGGDTPAPQPQPPPPAARCGDLELGESIAEACPAGPEQKLSVCTVDGLKVVRDCGGVTEPPPDDCDETTAFDAVQPTLTRDCKGCHAGYDTYATAKGKIREFIRRMELGSDNPQSMPRGARKSPAERTDYVAPFKAWERDGLLERCDDGNAGGGEPAPRLYDQDYLESTVLADVSAVGDVANRRTYRYLDALDRLNAGAQEELATWERGASKGLNSISFERKLVKPLKLADGIYRIDLDDYGLNAAEWRFIEDADKLDLESKTAKGQTLQVLLGTRKPILSVSAFLEATQRNSLVYYALTDTPPKFDDYTDKFGMAFDEDLEDADTTFIGVADSILSPHNRLIARVRSAFGRAYGTFDTGPLDRGQGAVRAKNLVQFPLLDGTGTRAPFFFEASEWIAPLPNGLFHYALFNAAGVLQQVAPVDVVADNESARRGLGAEIRAPGSCHRCHGPGYLPREDIIRAHVIANARDFAADYELILERYRPARENAAAFDEDNETFHDALAELDIDPTQPDPINGVLDEFLTQWTLRKLAAYLKLSEAEMVACIDRSPAGSAELGAVVTGAVTYDQVVLTLPALIDDCDLLEDPVGQ